MKKIVSLSLCLILLITTLSALVFDSSALELDSTKIYVKVADNYYEVEKGDVFTYEYRLKYTPDKIASYSASINYDSNAFQLNPVVDEYGEYDLAAMFPVTNIATVYNFKNPGLIRINYANISGIRFARDDSKVACLQFEVITDTAGIYEILSGFETLADVSSNVIVQQGVDYLEYTTVELIADLQPVTEATEPQTEATEQVTEAIEPTNASETQEQPEETEIESEDETELTEPESEETEPTQSQTEVSDDQKIFIQVDKYLYEVKTGDIFTYEFKLKYTESKITSLDLRVSYDSSSLEFIPAVDEYGDIDMAVMFPITGASTVYNFDMENMLLMNYAHSTGTRFMKDDSKVFSGQFKVTTDVPGIYVIGGRFETLADASLQRIVFKGEDLLDYTKGEQISDLTPINQDPTEPETDSTEPETESTEPETDPTEPETEPTEPETDPTEPETEPIEPETEPTEPETNPTEPETEPTEPETDPNEPETDPNEPEVTRLLGDVNGDGKVNILDATAIQRSEALFEKLTDEQLRVADTNKDGKVNILDATTIQRFVALFIPGF